MTAKVGAKGRASQAAVPAREYDEKVHLTIDLDREEDGRWIAEALELPGVMCYGQTRAEAISNAKCLAIKVIADRIVQGELPSSALGISSRRTASTARANKSMENLPSSGEPL